MTSLPGSTTFGRHLWNLVPTSRWTARYQCVRCGTVDTASVRCKP